MSVDIEPSLVEPSSDPSTAAPPKTESTEDSINDIDYTKKESKLEQKDIDQDANQDGEGGIAANQTPTEAQQDAKERGTARGRGRGSNQYINRTRHLTGGPVREKLTPEELKAKMEKVRLQNEAIIKRRELVEKDKDQYSEITEREKQERMERARKAVENKKIQLVIDEERNKNRARKLEKADRRDWDSEKAGDDALWKKNYKAYNNDVGNSPTVYRGRGRGRGRGSGGYGQGRGGHRNPQTSASENQPTSLDLHDKELFPALSKPTEISSSSQLAKPDSPSTEAK